MTPMRQFTLPLDPVPQGRPRVVRRGRHYGVKDPEASRRFKRELALLAGPHRLDPLPQGPLLLIVTFHCKAPQRSKDGPIFKGTRPDVDNLAKAVMDALQGILWRDDAQVAQLLATKRWARQGSIEVSLWGLEEGT